MSRILIVDDEPGIRQSLTGVFEDEGFTADSVSSGEECLSRIERENYDVVLLDIWLPGIDGLETLGRLRERAPTTLIIMISGHATIATAVKATKLGAYDFIEKPLSLEHTLLVVRRALSHRRLERANDILRNQLEERFHIVGESVPIKALRKQIGIAAPTNSRVLIYGESGTGKELVARNIHFLSKRANAPFVEVNCAAIPEELIESELFGHTKGSFTGASETKKGKFELADGGTLMLDEIGDMSLKTQAKVLRAVEDQRFQPIGAPAPVRVDVRVVAATNKNLPNEIAAGRFREDLFYRLNVIPFFVPPLRERRGDIPELARYFVRWFSTEHGRGPKELSADALDAMCDYSWPGNVRELRNEIERLVIMAPGSVIEPPDLSLPSGATMQASAASTLREGRAHYEREFILSALQECNGNVAQAARMLGLERSYLYRKMKAYGIEK
ncbi:MAG TPA: sigma-54 dependent transcriptional regulator [Terriglobia bacterium]|nr:sigma-54 dependent transcriptional regulator [Terriglobia bacterium]